MCSIFDVYPIREIDKKFYGITVEDVDSVVEWLDKSNRNFDDLTDSEKSALQYLCDIGYID